MECFDFEFKITNCFAISIKKSRLQYKFFFAEFSEIGIEIAKLKTYFSTSISSHLCQQNDFLNILETYSIWEILRKCEVFFCVVWRKHVYIFVIPREIAIVYSYLVGNIAARCEVFFSKYKEYKSRI